MANVGEVIVRADRLTDFVKAICEKDGSDAQEATIVAENLVLANLFGHDSHGVGMVPRYIENARAGDCKRNWHAEIVLDNGPLITVDGGKGYGQVVAREAMQFGIERAKAHGVCVVALRNCHHIGRIGAWGEQCADAGLISTHYVNVHGHKSLVAPFAGAEARFTTNPYCCTIPGDNGEHIVLDFATSQVAMGKVRVAYNKREQMEPGLLIDHDGNPSTDPGVMWGNGPFGAILPFGLHKGGGLAVICDILAGALTGGLTHSPKTIKHNTGDIVNNMLSIIIDPARLGGSEVWWQDTQDFVAWVKSSRPQPGVASVLVPGEHERQRRADRLAKGIAIDETTWGQLCDTARLVGLSEAEVKALTGV
ncbi:malate/lactate/ureidoglycolate dehydrogenase [Vineibacter terrae]|uniref:malate/lactate/ureidoglycolate dehydrogenase n=1 Tax=Vineibacter terrae TaxID=2586908 RepID=UPI002E3224C2|nr:malate/lactate/ureidoglycolate dehydrogenase [Vineibacter terrae]HEX2888308.1 malate/lactate/ureidoglycolate dehydrogenase [Vineibacter terrae]